MQLFTFWQSGSAYRVRIALNLKGIDYEPIFVRGGRGSEDLRNPEYLKLNPQGVIPTLIDGANVLNQTVAIMEYLDEAAPGPKLLPSDPAGRARVRALAQTIVSDTHPLIVARVIEHLDTAVGLEQDRVKAWLGFWNARGLGVIERMLSDAPATGAFCHGDAPTMADCCLVPQVFTAQRFGCDVSGLKTVGRVYAHCMDHPAFKKAAPENQPDAPKTAA